MSLETLIDNKKDDKKYLWDLLVNQFTIKNLENIHSMIDNNHVPFMNPLEHHFIADNIFLYAIDLGNEQVLKHILDSKKIHPNITFKTVTPLMYACYKEMSKLVEILIDTNEIDFTIKDSYGNTALMYACGIKTLDILFFREIHELYHKGNLDIVKQILGTSETEYRPLLANVENNEAITPLMIACNHPDNNSIVSELLKTKMSYPNNISKNGETALILATKKGNNQMVEMLINSGMSIPEYRYNDENTALMNAIKRVDPKMVDYIIKSNNSHPEYRNSDGFTALMMASIISVENDKKYQESLEITKTIFFDENAHHELEDWLGRTTIHIAVESNNIELCKFLIEHTETPFDLLDNDGNNILLSAISSDQSNNDIIKYLIDLNPNSTDIINNYNETPLMLTIFMRKFEIAHLLIDRNIAQLGVIDDDNNSALHDIIRLGHANNDIDLIHKIINHPDTPLNNTNDDGLTALNMLCKSYDFSDVLNRDDYKYFYETLIKMLILTGKSNPGEPDLNGYTPLFYSIVKFDNKEITKMIIDTGEANINSQLYDSGLTVLHTAVHYENEELVKLLLTDENINPLLKDFNNLTPHEYAIEQNLYEIIELLHQFTLKKSLPENYTIWQDICAYVSNFRLGELKKITQSIGIEGSTKEELCIALSKSLEEFQSILGTTITLEKMIDCSKNPDSAISLESFKDMDDQFILQDNKGFCYSLTDLKGLLKSQNPLNPYTRESLEEAKMIDGRKLVDVFKSDEYQSRLRVLEQKENLEHVHLMYNKEKITLAEIRYKLDKFVDRMNKNEVTLDPEFSNYFNPQTILDLCDGSNCLNLYNKIDYIFTNPVIINFRPINLKQEITLIDAINILNDLLENVKQRDINDTVAIKLWIKQIFEELMIENIPPPRYEDL